MFGLAISGAVKHAYNVDGWNLLPIFELWHPAIEVFACLLLACSVLATNIVCFYACALYVDRIEFNGGLRLRTL